MELDTAVKRLKVNDPTLIRLNLDSKEIGDKDAAAIADALKENTFLTWLDLGNNQIGDEGAKTIADMLKKNTSLISLNLVGNNQIGNKGGTAIEDALKINCTITTLRIGSKKLSNSRFSFSKKNKRYKKGIEASIARNCVIASSLSSQSSDLIDKKTRTIKTMEQCNQMLQQENRVLKQAFREIMLPNGTLREQQLSSVQQQALPTEAALPANPRHRPVSPSSFQAESAQFMPNKPTQLSSMFHSQKKSSLAMKMPLISEVAQLLQDLEGYLNKTDRDQMIEELENCRILPATKAVVRLTELKKELENGGTANIRVIK